LFIYGVLTDIQQVILKQHPVMKSFALPTAGSARTIIKLLYCSSSCSDDDVFVLFLSLSRKPIRVEQICVAVIFKTTKIHFEEEDLLQQTSMSHCYEKRTPRHRAAPGRKSPARAPEEEEDQEHFCFVPFQLTDTSNVQRRRKAQFYSNICREEKQDVKDLKEVKEGL
jgi:hypothetical protein